jgi:Domain of unknown function (DUF4872)
MLPRWPSMLAAGLLPEACQNGYLMIDAVGGTGGGMFRAMYARFLDAAAAITGDRALPAIVAQFRLASDRWQEVAAAFRTAHRATDPTRPLAEGRSAQVLRLGPSDNEAPVDESGVTAGEPAPGPTRRSSPSTGRCPSRSRSSAVR